VANSVATKKRIAATLFTLDSKILWNTDNPLNMAKIARNNGFRRPIDE
jgi:hypothetical protein